MSTLDTIIRTPFNDIRDTFKEDEGLTGVVGKGLFLFGAGNPVITLSKLLFPSAEYSFPYVMQGHLILAEVFHKIGANMTGVYSGTIEMSSHFFNQVGTTLSQIAPSWFEISNIYEKYGMPIATNVGAAAEPSQNIISLGLPFIMLPIIGSNLIEYGLTRDSAIGKALGKFAIGAGVFMNTYIVTSTFSIPYKETSLYMLFQNMFNGYNPSPVEFYAHAIALTAVTYAAGRLLSLGVGEVAKLIGNPFKGYLGSAPGDISQHSSS